MRAADLDALHDSGASMEAHIDHGRAVRPGRQVQRVNVDFPHDLLQRIDAEADRIGIARQAFIKLRLSDMLDKLPGGAQ